MLERVPCQTVEKAARQKLIERGVTIEAIAEIVFDLQKPYAENLDMASCIESTDAVLRKERSNMRY